MIAQELATTATDVSYTCTEAWRRMRLAHAHECQRFLAAHAKEALKLAKSLASHAALEKLLDEKVSSWLTSRVPRLNLQDQAYVTTTALSYARMCVRIDEHRICSKHVESQQTRQSTADILAKSNEKWQSMTMEQVVTRAMLQLQDTKFSKATPKSKPSIDRATPLGFLVDQLGDEDSLRKHYTLHDPVADSEGQKSKSTASAEKKTVPTSNRSRSNSKGSNASGRSAKSTGSRKPPSSSKSRGSSANSNKSGKFSQSAANRTGSAGKGKGKGSRKGGRAKTPAAGNDRNSRARGRGGGGGGRGANR